MRSCSRPSARPTVPPPADTAATGLGLAITRSFRPHAGRRRPPSPAGRARAPASCSACPSARPLPAAPSQSLPESGATVLVVDDDPAAQHIIGTHHARDGYRLLYAGSGAEALAMAREHRPDAITLDILMPQVDGWSVLHTLKGDPELASIPVVLVTANEDRSLGFELGAVAFLNKPVDRDELLQEMAECCDRPDRWRGAGGRGRCGDARVERTHGGAPRLPRGPCGQRATGRRLAGGESTTADDPARPADARDGRLRLPGTAPHEARLARHPGHRRHRQAVDDGRAPMARAGPRSR